MKAKSNTIRAVDGLTSQVLSELSRMNLADTDMAALRDIKKLIESIASDAERREGKVSRREADAADFVENAILKWSDHIRRSSEISGAKALYMSRRFPWHVLTPLYSDYAPAGASSAALVGGTQRLVELQLGENPYAGIDAPVVTRVAVYVFSASEIWNFVTSVMQTFHLWLLQNTARIVGKGGVLEFLLSEAPYSTVTPEQRRSMDLFDARNAYISDVGIIGTKAFLDAHSVGRHTIPLCLSRGGEAKSIEVPAGLVGDAEINEKVSRSVSGEEVAQRELSSSKAQGKRVLRDALFDVEHVSLEPFARMMQGVKGDSLGSWGEELPAVLELLYSLGATSDSIYMQQMKVVGYLRVRREELCGLLEENRENFLSFIDDVLPGGALSVRRSVLTLMRLSGSLYPNVDGPIVHKVHDGWILVDVAMATRRLVWLLAFARADGGSIGSARGFHFEDHVQSKIDCIGFGTDVPEIRSLIGKNLHRDGRGITDIDAIAKLPSGAHLLVQAKSYPYTAEYSAGMFRAVRSRRTEVEQQVVKWGEKIDFLLGHRTGANQNYSLDSDAEFHWIIVTPFSVYLEQPLCDVETLPGLRRVSSLLELTDWLEGLSMV